MPSVKSKQRFFLIDGIDLGSMRLDAGSSPA
jgi:hypothetical protein